MSGRHAPLIILLALVGVLTLSSPALAEERFFDSDGVTIRFLDVGEGEPVVLVHGFAATAEMNWGINGVLSALARSHRVLAIDCRGHGRSDKPHESSAYGMKMVEDLVRLLDHLGIEKAHVVGYSMGGLITMKLIATHPDRIRSAIVGGHGWHRAEDEAAHGFAERIATSLEEGKGFRILLDLTRPEQTGPPPEMIAMLDATLGPLNDAKALAAAARGWQHLTVTEKTLRENWIPTLVLIGENDPLKAGVDALDGVMAHAEIQILGGADHMTAMMRPDFRAAIRGFLARSTVPEERVTEEAQEPAQLDPSPDPR
jgi:pimeloyl-ACP methyl ester carboxylesterase